MNDRQKEAAFRTRVVLSCAGVLAAVVLLGAAAPGLSRFQALVSEARQRVRTISVEGLRARMAEGGFALIDVREDSEWAAGRLPGAVHIARGVLERDIEKAVPDPHAEIVLYCSAGSRSVLAAESLQKMGYDNVFSLEGGAQAWMRTNVASRPDGKAP